MSDPGDHGYDDLRGVDLSELDLDDIELDSDRPPSSIWRWVTLAALLGLGGMILWLPNTELYRASSSSPWLFATVSVAATIIGALGGGWLWRWAEEASARWAKNRRPRTERPEQPPSALSRWLTLLAAIGGIVGILYALDSGSLTGGTSGYSGWWYLAAIAAIGVGVLVGRWLLLQQYNPFERRGPRRPIVLPPWVKWLTLAVIVGAAVIISIGSQIFGTGSPETLEFTLGGAAFVLGIVAAIWVARRFDETEARLRREAQNRRAVRVATPPSGKTD